LRDLQGSIALVAFAGWTAVTVVTAATRGEGHGAVFISALILLGILLLGAVWLLVRIQRGETLKELGRRASSRWGRSRG
jgi:hypothetical protein